MSPRSDEALAALAKELAAVYITHNGVQPERGTFDAMLSDVVEHAVIYAFRIGYRTRVNEETAEEKVLS